LSLAYSAFLPPAEAQSQQSRPFKYKKKPAKETRHTYTRDMEITRHVLDAYASVMVNSQLDTPADLLTNIH